MAKPTFDSKGIDAKSYAPFILEDTTEDTGDYCLTFSDWGWLEETYGGSDIGDFDFSGETVEDLVRAARQINGLPGYPDGIEYDSDNDSCQIHFMTLHDAVQTAELAGKMMHDENLLAQAIAKVEASYDDDEDDSDGAFEEEEEDED